MRYLRILGALLAAATGLAIASAAPAQAATMFMNPSSGPAGSTFEIVAAGFLPSEAVHFTWDGGPLAVTEADIYGNVAAQATVPHDAAVGGHSVKAEGGSSGLGAARPFNVTRANTAAAAPPAAAPAAPPAASTPPPAAAPSAPAAAPAAAPVAPAVPAGTDAAAPTGTSGLTATVPTVPDGETAEVAFDVRVPLPLGANPEEPPELWLLTAFALFSVSACRTVAVGRKLRVW